MFLSKTNKHERDNNIKFYQSGHKYEINTDSKTKYTSVTTWNHNHFPKFDADAVIRNIMKGKNWGPENKYWGLTPQQIKASWKNNGTIASQSGTFLHDQIEKFMNNDGLSSSYTHTELLADYKKKVMKEGIVEWNYFIEFIKDNCELKPYRTEWMIYDEDVKIAGSIDMVYENLDGTLSIYDWKRSKDITKINNWNTFATNPIINHMPDANFWHYALQLNTYKAILERKYGKKVTKLCLVRLHPDNSDDTYELLEVPMLDEYVSKLFEERIRELEN